MGYSVFLNKTFGLPKQILFKYEHSHSIIVWVRSLTFPDQFANAHHHLPEQIKHELAAHSQAKSDHHFQKNHKAGLCRFGWARSSAHFKLGTTVPTAQTNARYQRPSLSPIAPPTWRCSRQPFSQLWLYSSLILTVLDYPWIVHHIFTVYDKK